MIIGERIKYRYQDIEDLPDNHYVGCDFSHAKITADLSGKRLDNCILYNTDLTGANIDKSTQFNFAGRRNPFTSKKHNGEPITKITQEQLNILTRKEHSL